MLFLTIGTIKPENVNAALARFKKENVVEPAGLRILERVFDVGGHRFFALSETDDPVTLAKLSDHWDDLVEFEVIPVIRDDQLASVFKEK